MQNRRVNRRRRNLPAELKVEIVDCLPLENAVHFLANVPNRLIIHHCAPRIRRILKMIPQITHDYAHTLLASNIHGHYIGSIQLCRGRKYTPAMDIFLRHGHGLGCRTFVICRGTSNGFVGYPLDFFNNLIRFYYETKVPENVVPCVDIALSLNNPAQWPTALLQPQMGEMRLEELEIDYKMKNTVYILRNKHNPDIKFELGICFQGEAKIYHQMTYFYAVCKGERSG